MYSKNLNLKTINFNLHILYLKNKFKIFQIIKRYKFYFDFYLDSLKKS